MIRRRDPVLFPYTKPSKDQLVDFINVKNNRLFSPDQLLFDEPAMLKPDGLSTVNIRFALNIGWTSDSRPLKYWRVDLNKLLDGPLSIWVKEHTTEAIYHALLEQYGILIEPELFTLTQTLITMQDSLPVTEIPSFDSEDGEVSVMDDEFIEPYADNRNYTLKVSDKHLIWFGEVEIRTRRALEVLGQTIDSTMDLREFYRQGSFDKPNIELYTPNGVFLLDDTRMERNKRREWESIIYTMKEGEVIEDDTVLAELLKLLTGDNWIVTSEPRKNFNIKGSVIAYNGFVNSDYRVFDKAYNYVIAISLGDLCDNLKGLLKIAYRYSSANTPSNLDQDRSNVLPIFAH